MSRDPPVGGWQSLTRGCGIFWASGSVGGGATIEPFHPGGMGARPLSPPSHHLLRGGGGAPAWCRGSLPAVDVFARSR